MKRDQYQHQAGFAGHLERAHVHCRICGDKVSINDGIALWRRIDGQDHVTVVCKGSAKGCDKLADPQRKLLWTPLKRLFMTVLYHHGQVRSWEAFMDAANYRASNQETVLAATLLFDAGVRSAAKWRAEIASMKAWHAAVAHVNREFA